MKTGMKHYAFTLWLLGVTASANAETLSLSQYLDQVRASNPQVSASQLQAQAEKARAQVAGTWEDPFVAIGPDEIPFGGGMGYVIRYQLSQPIPFPGKLSARQNAQLARAEGAQAETVVLQRQLILTAVQNYFQLLYLGKALGLNEENQSTMRDLVQSNRSRYETGTGSHHEWLLASIEENTLKTERLRLERERASQQAILNELRLRPLDDSIVAVPLDNTVPSWSKSITDALAQQPEFEAMQSGLRAAEAELRSERLGYWPDFVAQGMIMQSGHEEEPSNFGVMLGATIPLFTVRRQGGAVDAARKDKQALSLNRQALELRLRTEWHEAELAYHTALDTVALYEASVLPTTELALKSAQTGYSARTASLADYINTLRAYRTQQLEYLAARLDLHMAVWRKMNLLAAPPVTRFAPETPTLFGAGGMASGMPSMGMPKDTGMGRGVPVPNAKDTMQSPAQPGGGMKGM